MRLNSWLNFSLLKGHDGIVSLAAWLLEFRYLILLLRVSIQCFDEIVPLHQVVLYREVLCDARANFLR